ncbi:hypothetical protein ACWF99_01060 [Nocardia sp. NPDC055002]
MTTGKLPTTARLGEAIRIAQHLADDEGQLVGPEALFSAIVLDAEPRTRCRLILRQLGVDRAFTDQDRQEMAALSDRFGPGRIDIGFTDRAAAVLGRMQYWASRTGDRSADTSHLLLACLEQRDISEIVHQFGATTNDVIRTALAVRRAVAPTDRPIESAGPILSPSRLHRPATHAFDADETSVEHFRTYTSTISRSQLAGAGHMSSRIQRHLVRLHMLVSVATLVAAVSLLVATAYCAVTATFWSLIWLGCNVRRDRFALIFRLAVDLSVVALSFTLGVPLWPAILVVVYRVCDVFEERLGLIQVRSAVAEPALSLRTLRDDRRINYRGANNHIVNRLTRRSSSDAIQT